ncbi:MAG TPA: hypothetical protein VF285_01310 [Castellaniella sp.]|uniref:hypothetical protein n=1 Tax=Castellaniella sp. TaxID=1955812 RepID=UPI002F111071
MMKSVHVVAALVLSVAAVPSFAQEARVHGTIEQLDHSVLTVKAQTGDVLKIQLAKDTTVTAMTAATLADIKPGKFVGTAAHPGGPDGALVAIEVHIFADSMRGTGEGHRPMTQGNTMTNATVESIVSGVHDRTLTLRYKGGEQKVMVPANVPIVMLTPSDRGALKRGDHVSFNATRRADGAITAAHVTVGVNGLVPPL